MPAPEERVDLRRAWPALASCALAVVALVAFFSTTTLNVEFSYGGKDKTSFGVNFASSMDWWYHASVIAALVAGSILGGVGGRAGRPLRPLAWIAGTVNAIAAIVLGAFIVFAYIQSRSAG